jgi:hypothetical protein
MAKQKTNKAVQQEEASDVSSNSSREDVKKEAVKKVQVPMPNAPNAMVRESLTDQIEYYTELAFLDRRERLAHMVAADVRIRI